MELLEFTVDQGIIKTDLGRILCGVRKINAGKARPIDGAETHGTWLAGSVKFTILEFERVQLCASGSDCQHFRMGGGVVGGANLIRPFGNDLVVSNDERSERATASGEDSLQRELSRTCHERSVQVFSAAIASHIPPRAQQVYGPVLGYPMLFSNGIIDIRDLKI